MQKTLTRGSNKLYPINYVLQKSTKNAAKLLSEEPEHLSYWVETLNKMFEAADPKDIYGSIWTARRLRSNLRHCINYAEVNYPNCKALKI